MNTIQFDGFPVCAIFECLRQHLQFLIRNLYYAVTMCLNVPVPVLVLDTATHTMPIMRKASIYRAGVE